MGERFEFAAKLSTSPMLHGFSTHAQPVLQAYTVPANARSECTHRQPRLLCEFIQLPQLLSSEARQAALHARQQLWQRVPAAGGGC